MTTGGKQEANVDNGSYEVRECAEQEERRHEGNEKLFFSFLLVDREK